MQTPPPHLQACFPPPTTTKNKTAYVHFYRVSQSAYWSELDTLSDSSWLPNSATNNPPCPYPATIKKKKKRLSIVFELFCLVNNFMIWKKKKKRRRRKKRKRKFLMVVAGFHPEPMDYETRALPLSYRNQLQPRTLQNMYLYSIWRLGPYDLRPVQSHNSNFD